MATPKPSFAEQIRLLEEAAHKLVQARILLRDAGSTIAVSISDALDEIDRDIRIARFEQREAEVEAVIVCAYRRATQKEIH